MKNDNASPVDQMTGVDIEGYASREAAAYVDWLRAGNSTGELSEHAVAGLQSHIVHIAQDVLSKGIPPSPHLSVVEALQGGTYKCRQGNEVVVSFPSEDQARAFRDLAYSVTNGRGIPPARDVAGGEPAAWLHPTAGWAHADYHQVRLHCFNDGPMPVPLYRAAATEADHG